jgi:hypothetical protein
MAKKPPPGLTLVKDTLDGGKETPPLPPERPEGEGPRFPEGCPVVPLGVRGGRFNFLDVNGDHIKLPALQVTRRTIYGVARYFNHTRAPRIGARRSGVPRETTAGNSGAR